MKKIFFIIAAYSALLLTSCDKDSEGLNYDFSNSLPPYAEVIVDAPEVVEGEPATFVFQIRTALQEPVTLTYDQGGVLTGTGMTIELPKGATSVELPVETADLIPMDETSASATITLTKAVSASGIEFRLGSLNDGSAQVAEITISKE
jgi:hypothetical protein